MGGRPPFAAWLSPVSAPVQRRCRGAWRRRRRARRFAASGAGWRCPGRHSGCLLSSCWSIRFTLLVRLLPDYRLNRHGHLHGIAVFGHRAIESEPQLGLLLILLALLRFGYVPNHFGVLRYQNISALRLHVHGDLRHHFITGLRFLGVHGLRELHGDHTAGCDASRMLSWRRRLRALCGALGCACVWGVPEFEDGLALCASATPHARAINAVALKRFFIEPFSFHFSWRRAHLHPTYIHR